MLPATKAPSQSPAVLRNVSLSLVIPAFNESDVIEQAMQEAVDALSRITATFEVIVVDDGSSDNTAQLVENFSKFHAQVRLWKQPKNMGYGAALRAGFQAATMELVAFTDADCQFHLQDLDYLVELAEHFDIVSGYRIDRKDSSLRRFCSWGYNTLVQCLMGSPIRDIDCALKVFRREALLTILPETNEFFANTEMFSKATELGLKIVDVGVQHRPRAAGHSKVRLTDVPRTLDSLLPYWWRIHFAGSRPTRETEGAGKWSWMAIALLALAAAILGSKLSYPLIEPDEGRYAEIMREMARTGNWLVPQLHFEPYMDKPPLFYWLGAISIKIFGPHDWAVRLVSAVAAWLTIAATYLLGRKMLGERSALLGTLVLTLSVGFTLCGRYVILDSLLSLFVTAALFSGLVAAFANESWSWRMWTLSAALCGLGVLTKGPLAIVLVVPPLLAHCWLKRVGNGLTLQAWKMYLGIVVAINAPWYLVMSIYEPGFVKYFFWDHNIARFMSGSNHPQPFWFYLPILILGWMPWGGLLFPLVPFLASRSDKRRDQRNSHVGALAIAVVWCLSFLSLSSGKLPTYIVPCFPMLALLIGHYLNCTKSPFTLQQLEQAKLHGLFWKAGAGICLAGVVYPVIMWLIKLETASYATGHLIAWACAGVILVVVHRRLSPRVMWGTYCAIALVVTIEANHHVFPAWAKQHAILSPKTDLARQMEQTNARVACLGPAHGSVAFYLDRNDVAQLKWDRPEEITQFVTTNPETYLIFDEKLDLSALRKHLPANRSMQHITTGRAATIVRIDAVTTTPLVATPEAQTAHRDSLVQPAGHVETH